MEKYRPETAQPLPLENLIRTFNQFVIDVKKADDEQRGNGGVLLTRLKQIAGNLRALRNTTQTLSTEQLAEISGKNKPAEQSLLQEVFHGFPQRKIADEYLAVADWLLEAGAVFDTPVLERMLSAERPQTIATLVSVLLKTPAAPHLHSILTALNPTAREHLDRALQALPEGQPIRSLQALMHQAATPPVTARDIQKLSDEQRNALKALLQRFLANGELSNTDPLYRTGLKVTETGNLYTTGPHHGTLLSFTVWRQGVPPRECHWEIARWALKNGMDPERPHGTAGSTALKELANGRNQHPEMLALFRQYSANPPVLPASVKITAGSAVAAEKIAIGEAETTSAAAGRDPGTQPQSPAIGQGASVPAFDTRRQLMEAILAAAPPEALQHLVSVLRKAPLTPHLHNALAYLSQTARARLDVILQALPDNQPVRSLQALEQQAVWQEQPPDGVPGVYEVQPEVTVPITAASEQGQKTDIQATRIPEAQGATLSLESVLRSLQILHGNLMKIEKHYNGNDRLLPKLNEVMSLLRERRNREGRGAVLTAASLAELTAPSEQNSQTLLEAALYDFDGRLIPHEYLAVVNWLMASGVHPGEQELDTLLRSEPMEADIDGKLTADQGEKIRQLLNKIPEKDNLRGALLSVLNRHNLYAKGKHGATALLWIAWNSQIRAYHKEAASLLLELGADAKRPQGAGEQIPLQSARRGKKANEQLAALFSGQPPPQTENAPERALLVNAGARVIREEKLDYAHLAARVDKAGNLTPLGKALRQDAHWLLQQRNPAAATALLEVLITGDINWPGFHDRTALHWLIRGPKDEKTLEIAGRLLDAGARLDAVDTRNSTPLHLAAKENRRELLQLSLARHIADPQKHPLNLQAQDGFGKTPGHWPMMDSRRSDEFSIELLTFFHNLDNRHADEFLHLKDNRGNTPVEENKLAVRRLENFMLFLDTVPPGSLASAPQPVPLPQENFLESMIEELETVIAAVRRENSDGIHTGNSMLLDHLNLIAQNLIQALLIKNISAEKTLQDLLLATLHDEKKTDSATENKLHATLNQQVMQQDNLTAKLHRLSQQETLPASPQASLAATLSPQVIERLQQQKSLNITLQHFLMEKLSQEKTPAADTGSRRTGGRHPGRGTALV